MKTIRIMMLGIAVLFFHHVSIAQTDRRMKRTSTKSCLTWKKPGTRRTGNSGPAIWQNSNDWTIWFMFLPDMDRETNANTHQGLF